MTITIPAGLSVKEYADAQNLTPNTIYRHLWQNKIQGATQVLGRWILPDPNSITHADTLATEMLHAQGNA